MASILSLGGGQVAGGRVSGWCVFICKYLSIIYYQHFLQYFTQFVIEEGP